MSSTALKEIVPDMNGLGGGKVIGHVVGVSNAKEDETINKTVDVFSKLDGEANLVGVIGKDINKRTIADLSVDDWEIVSGVNLEGTIHCMRAQINKINDAGTIINASNVCGGHGIL